MVKLIVLNYYPIIGLDRFQTYKWLYIYTERYINIYIYIYIYLFIFIYMVRPTPEIQISEVGRNIANSVCVDN